MGEHVLYNKKKLCFTEVSDFTDFQGVGSDPLYKRFDSVKAVLRTCIDDKYMGFLAQPMYNSDEDTIEWYVDSWEEHPRRLIDLTGEERIRYEQIKEETVQHYRNAAQKLEDSDLMILGGVLKYIPDETIFCYDNKVVLVCWGMCYDTNKHKDIGSLMHNIPLKPKTQTYYQVRFNPGTLGSFEGNGIVNLQAGESIPAAMIPAVNPSEGYRFTGWDTDPTNFTANNDMVFTAQYEKVGDVPPIGIVNNEEEKEKEKEEPKEVQFHKVQFLAGDFGKLKGTTSYTVPSGCSIKSSQIPKVKTNWRYKFTGWDVDPLNSAITGDTVFTAQYEKKKNWFAAIWPWLWKILLALLLLLLLILLLKYCSRPRVRPVRGIDDRPWVIEDPNVSDGGGIYDPGNPYKPIPTPPEHRDILPPDQGTMPPIRDDDPIRQDPGKPTIISNRLNVMMENEDKSIISLARDFKTRYPGDQYQVVYYDDVIKLMQITVPENEREAIKERLPQEFAPEYQLFVFDESLFEGPNTPNDPDLSNQDKKWYLDAIGAFEAWNTTTGSEDVTVAVVDNGFSLKHKEFKNKIVMPYYVWGHNDQIFAQQIDHGTHVAGTAIAAADNGLGLCGIAPGCQFMPVQVADQAGRMTTLSVLNGVLYSIYQGADVINISLGGTFSGLDRYPQRMQLDLIRNHFKEEERLWNHVAKIAETHKTIIVVAAGNDNVLAGIEALQRPKSIIVVSAVDKSLRNASKADFSNYGEYSTVSAPGVGIYSCYGNRGFEFMDGTSMASPIVAGSVALMKSINRDITAEQVICVLQSTGKQVEGDIGPMIQLNKALQKVKNNDLDSCQPEEEEVPETGDVEITLSWGNYNDLDLQCIEPSGELLNFKNDHSRSGGVFQIDKNVSPTTTEPIEHIYWPDGSAPEGTYTVRVHYFRHHVQSEAETPFSVRIKYGNVVETYTGTMTSPKQLETVCTFTLNGNSRNGGGGGTVGGGDNNNDSRRQDLINRRDQLQRELDDINRQLRNYR